MSSVVRLRASASVSQRLSTAPSVYFPAAPSAASRKTAAAAGKVGGAYAIADGDCITAPDSASLDMIGGQASYQVNGTFGDGKGQPGQSNAVSHGCPPARFRQVNVLNTAVRRQS